MKNRHKGKKAGQSNPYCSRCENKKDNIKKRYCRKCNAAYIRDWRKNNPISDEERFKRNVRSKTNMRIKRGLIIKQPCEICKNEEVEAHHTDYDKPYEIKWLCRAHHKELHKK